MLRRIGIGVIAVFFAVAGIIIANTIPTISTYLLISLALLGTVACTNSDFKRTKSGMQYKIFSDGKGSPAKKGQFLKSPVGGEIPGFLSYIPPTAVSPTIFR